MRGPIKYQASQVWSKLDGIGISKADYRKENPVKNVDNTRSTSPLVHSFKYKDETFNTCKNLFMFAHQRGVKDMTKITIDIVENWFEEKIDRELTRDTLRNYLSLVVKIQIALEAIADDEGNDYTGFTKEDLSHIHQTIKSMDRNNGYDRAYKNPGLMIGLFSDERMHFTGILQWKYGLRITEASHIKEKQLKDTTLTFSGKGGYPQIKELTEEHANTLRRLMVDGLFKVNQNKYRRGLEEHALALREKYSGSHGLRYNYLQNVTNVEFYKEVAKGTPPEKAMSIARKIASKEAGHHREDIIRVYTW